MESVESPVSTRLTAKPSTLWAARWAIISPTVAKRVVLGQDTRESSGWMADIWLRGCMKQGSRVESAGVVPTPAVARLAHSKGFSAGVVISASHNPWRDNGIKVFGGDGYKLLDATELEIEGEIFALLKTGAQRPASPPAKPSLPGDSGLRLEYSNGWPAPSPARIV